MKQILLKNGSVRNPDGRLEREDILIEKDRIRQIGRIVLRPDMVVTDISGALVLPGMIDPHVHFREPGFVAKEGIENGSKAAIKGWVTTLFEMPNTDPPCDSSVVFDEKRSLLAQKSMVNWGLHFMASPDMWEIPERAVSAKIFMARSSSRSAWNREEALMAMFRKARRVTIHAEDETYFTHESRHHLRRPRKAIRRALETIRRTLILLPEKERPRVILCHASTLEDIRWLSEMKANGFDVWGETAPHYLWFTSENEQESGARYQVNPPLRDPADRDAIRQAVRDGIVDFIGTDHAPHILREKMSPDPPSGIPGIEWAVPALLELVEQQIIPWSRLIRLICGGAANCYGIPDHSGLQTGSAANIIFLKKDKKEESVITKAGYNPYEQIPLVYAVDKVMINGKWVYTENRFNDHIKGKEIFGAFSP